MKISNRILAEQLLKALYEKMFFRKRLPSEGWAINVILFYFRKVRRMKND